MKLLLGCGLTKTEGYVRVDYDPKVKPDVLIDLESGKKWPWDDNSVDEIKADNLLEHIKNIDHFMEQAYRVLKPDGLLHILVPHFMNYQAYYDPDHIRYFAPQSFIYWSRDTTGSDGRPVIRANCDYRIEKMTTHVDPKALSNFTHEHEKQVAMKHYWNVCTFIEARLRTIKPLRPGTIGKYGVKP